MKSKEDCETLMNALMEFGKGQLVKYKEFYPYGAVIDKEEQIKLTMANGTGNEFPDSTDLINELKMIHHGLAEDGEIITSGIAWNGRIMAKDGKKNDAIVMSLEHKDNYSVIVCLPYKIGFLKKVTFGELEAVEGNNDIF